MLDRYQTDLIIKTEDYGRDYIPNSTMGSPCRQYRRSYCVDNRKENKRCQDS
nr:MAG TPA: hypothetical protein [Caudoviricetes sp.]